MNQLEIIFSYRRTDPVTSKKAADEITKDGTRSRGIERAIDAVRTNQGKTAREISRDTGIGEEELRKRIYDALNRGNVVKGSAKRCDVSGKSAATWYIA